MATEHKDMYIRTSFTPLRMVVGQKHPVALQVEIRNKSEKTRDYSVFLRVPTYFGFDKGCLKKESRVRVARVGPSGSKEAVFHVFGQYNIPEGFHDFYLIVREHEDERFDKELGQERLTIPLRVVH